MAMCPMDCCSKDPNEIDMRVKGSASAPGMQAGTGLPEPPPRAIEQQTDPLKNPEQPWQQETPFVVPPPPVKKDESNIPGSQGGAAQDNSPFVVELQKTPTMAKVGLDVDHGDEQALQVMLVKEGLVQIYNEGAAENRMIKIGDAIIEVNGIQGDARKMLEAVGREAKLRFVVRPNARRD